jgi:hypothetical protein
MQGHPGRLSVEYGTYPYQDFGTLGGNLSNQTEYPWCAHGNFNHVDAALLQGIGYRDYFFGGIHPENGHDAYPANLIENV